MAKSRRLAARGPIYGALRSADGPMTAYEILDAVRDKGITAPPTVYRALNRLVEEGLAHRVESINAYVACAHSHHSDGAVVFAICDNCGTVSEIEDSEAVAMLRGEAEADGFMVQRVAAEIRGLCGPCREQAGSNTDVTAQQ
jgi:Fur family zinc uptake transcriptional regulator